MRPWNADLERREAVRMPTRLPCAVWVGCDRREGVLEHVSPRCVVVRTEAVVPDSLEVNLSFSAPTGARFTLRAIRVRERAVAHTLRGLLSPSVVLHLREPSDAYLRWVDAPTPSVT
jgi:hypothetical protein